MPQYSVSDAEILREIGVHGRRWEGLHGGYFSDPAVASCLVKRIRETLPAAHADVVVDLAGGTGCVLSELMRSGIDPRIRLVNIDLSGRQLRRTAGDRIMLVRKSITDFRRSDVGIRDSRVVFIMRSALHYFGKENMTVPLGYIRSQMIRGEFFIHQSASFAFRDDASFMNGLYEKMGTEKWYPTVRELRKSLKTEGWSIVSVSRAPDLVLTSGDLAKRYNLNEDKVREIGREISSYRRHTDNLFAKADGGFCARLHYYIYKCRAV